MSGDDLHELAETVWAASRADESTISGAGAVVVAHAILLSHWLGRHDVRVRAEALREAADDRPALQQALCAEDDRHFAAGSSHGAGPDVSCDVFEDWLRERADRIDGGAR